MSIRPALQAEPTLGVRTLVNHLENPETTFLVFDPQTNIIGSHPFKKETQKTLSVARKTFELRVKDRDNIRFSVKYLEKNSSPLLAAIETLLSDKDFSLRNALSRVDSSAVQQIPKNFPQQSQKQAPEAQAFDSGIGEETAQTFKSEEELLTADEISLKEENQTASSEVEPDFEHDFVMIEEEDVKAPPMPRVLPLSLERPALPKTPATALLEQAEKLLTKLKTTKPEFLGSFESLKQEFESLDIQRRDQAVKAGYQAVSSKTTDELVQDLQTISKTKIALMKIEEALENFSA